MACHQICELHRLLGKKTLEAEILKEALDAAADPKKTPVALAVVAQGQFAMKAVCEVLGVARSNIAARAKSPLCEPRPGRPALPDDEMVVAIQAIVTDMPSYGYRRVWALLRRVARAEGRPAPNHKRVYRVMKTHGLLL